MRRLARGSGWFGLVVGLAVGCGDDGGSSGETDATASGADTEGTTGDGSASDPSASSGSSETSPSTSGPTSSGSASGTEGESDSDGTTGGPGGSDDPVPPQFTVCDDGPTGQTLRGDPSTYRNLLDTMLPGDRLALAAGIYDQGLPITDMNGSEGSCFFIEGPEDGDPAVFTGSDSRNTVSIRDSSFVVIRNLELDGLGLAGDGVKAEGTATYAHHIVLENLHIHGHDGNQQIVGISTKCPAWHWVIRGNWIETAGTGLYLGNSDGGMPFIGGLIEHNVVLDTVGYNMQIKHQNPRPDVAGIPQGDEVTIIRHNVLSKQNGAAGGGDARPNLLLGHQPTSGVGAEDHFVVYGNFFHDNATEALMQAEGNLAIHHNVFVNPSGSALNIQPHNAVPREVHLFFNTVVASGSGIRITGGEPNHTQRAIGNAVFADPAISADVNADNILGTYAEAGSALVDSTSNVGEGLDVHPSGTALDVVVNTDGLDPYLRWDHDFDARPHDPTIAGAYAGPDDGSGWVLDRDYK